MRAPASWVKNHSFRTYDWAGAERLLDMMLSSYSLADEVAQPAARAAE